MECARFSLNTNQTEGDRIMDYFKPSFIYGITMFSIVGGILYLLGSDLWLPMAIGAFVTNFLFIFIFAR